MIKILVATAAVCWTISIAAASPAHGPAIGRWVEANNSCSAFDDYSTELLLEIGVSEVERYESSCSIIDSTANGETYSIRLLCEGEGETFFSDLRLTLTNERLTDNDHGTSYKRC